MREDCLEGVAGLSRMCTEAVCRVLEGCLEGEGRLSGGCGNSVLRL